MVLGNGEWNTRFQYRIRRITGKDLELLNTIAVRHSTHVNAVNEYLQQTGGLPSHVLSSLQVRTK